MWAQAPPPSNSCRQHLHHPIIEGHIFITNVYLKTLSTSPTHLFKSHHVESPLHSCRFYSSLSPPNILNPISIPTQTLSHLYVVTVWLCTIHQPNHLPMYPNFLPLHQPHLHVTPLSPIKILISWTHLTASWDTKTYHIHLGFSSWSILMFQDLCSSPFPSPWYPAVPHTPSSPSPVVLISVQFSSKNIFREILTEDILCFYWNTPYF